MILPPYKGSTLRGGFGSAFRQVVCVVRNGECGTCILKGKCVYSYVFETPPPAGTKVMRKYEAAPHPFVIEPPEGHKQIYEPGEQLRFNLILIGRAIDYLPYFIYTFDQLGARGIGKGRARFHLQSVQSEGVTIYDGESKTLRSFRITLLPLEDSSGDGNSPSTMRISFVIPTRIVYATHLTLDLEFHTFIRNLLRRASLLSYFHCDGDPSGVDFKWIIDLAQNVRTSRRELKWYDWKHHSGRQDRQVKMVGLWVR